MGRPPIGARAMTEAERKRRQRALLRASKPVTASADSATLAEELTAVKAELAAAKARIAGFLGMRKQVGRVVTLYELLDALSRVIKRQTISPAKKRRPRPVHKRGARRRRG